MWAALQFEFMRNALLAALLVSVACGIVGSYVVVRRMVFISGGIAHASFGGIGLAYFLGLNPVLGVIPFSIASALGIGYVSHRTRLAMDTTIGMWWALGMALGVVFIALSPGYAPDLFSYLFGNILTVSRVDLGLMVALDLVVVCILLLRYPQLLSLSFDEEFARATGVRVDRLHFLLLCLVALTVVVLIRIVGIILVIALLTVPAMVSWQFTRVFHRMILAAIGLSAVFAVSGLWISYVLDLPSGAAIVLVASAGFFLSLGVKRLRRARPAAHASAAANPGFQPQSFPDPENS